MARRMFVAAATRGNRGGVEFFTCAIAAEDLRRLGTPFRRKRADRVDQERGADQFLTRGSEDAVFPVIAFVDGVIEFAPIGDDEITRNLGRLFVHAPRKMRIISGVALRTVNHDPVGDDAIPTVIVSDPGLKRFAKTLAAIAATGAAPRRLVSGAHDRRFRAARVAECVMASVPFFRDLTETEKSTISNRSVKMFTLTGIRNATEALLAGLGLESDQDRIDTAVDFWTEVGRNIPEWQLASDRDASPADLRRQFIHAHTLALAAIARAGNQLLSSQPRKWKAAIKRLAGIDWRRGNAALWDGRAMNAGRLSKHNVNVTLTANVVKEVLGLPLSAAEHLAEQEFRKMRKNVTGSKR